MPKYYTYITYLLTALILLVSSKISACSCDFVYDNYSVDGTVTFQANSELTVNPSYTWTLGDGQIATGETYTHTYSSSGKFMVCLSILDDNNCYNEFCEYVMVTNQYENDCEINDCVYPGDTNKDGSANIYDIFSIGMHYGEYGPARPNATNDWDPQPCQDWSSICINGNLKHTDCNGDGVIDQEDLIPIIANYQNDHSYDPQPNSNPDAPEIHLEFNSDSITINNENPGLVDAFLDIIIGSETTPVDYLYSLAFSINFLDNELIQPGSISVEYNTESFFCSTDDVIMLSKVTEDGMVDLGFSRTDYLPVSGFGRLARVNFTIIGDLIVSRTNESPLGVETHGMHGIDEFGTDLGFATKGDEINFKIDSTSPLKNHINNNLFEISPNPSNGFVNINTGNQTINDIKVYSIAGKLLLQQTAQKDNNELDLSAFPNGTYLIKVSNDGESATKRVVISK